MDNQEARGILANLYSLILADGSIQLVNNRIVALGMAIEAFEKQIPKKPNMIKSRHNANLWDLYCPSCENWIGIWNSRLRRWYMHNTSNGNICPHCGRTIDCTEV